MNLVSAISDLLAVLTLIGDLLLLGFAAYLVYRKTTGKKFSELQNLLRKKGLLFAFIVALIATTGSLFYSDIAGYNPCKLCWYQRIFAYPQVVLLGAALVKKFKHEIIYYSLSLSAIGAVIAAYHYYLQRWGGDGTNCAAVGYSESCAKNFVLSFGYITIPMMALTAFLLIIVFVYFPAAEDPKGFWERLLRRD